MFDDNCGGGSRLSSWSAAALANMKYRVIDDIQRAKESPYLPILFSCLYSLAFGWRGSFIVGNHALYALRALPTTPLFCGLLFASIYRKELQLGARLKRNSLFWISTGLALAPIFILVFANGRFSLGLLLGRIVERFSSHFGLEHILQALAIPLGGWPLRPGGNPEFLRWVGMAGEELFFRGVIYGLIRAKDGSFLKAAFWSSFFFALWHGNPFLVPFYFLWGFAAAAIYEISGSLWVPISVHLLYNWMLAHSVFPRIAFLGGCPITG